MKSIITSLAIVLGLTIAPVTTAPVWAQSTSSAQMDALNEMIAWMQASGEIQTDLMALFGQDIVQEMYAVLDTGDRDEIARFGEKFNTRRELVLARAERQINALPKPEKWDIDPGLFSRQDAATYRAAMGQYNSLQDTFEEYSNMSAGLVEMFTKMDTLDGAALLQLQTVQMKSATRMVEMENRQIDDYLLAIPPNNPNHQFQKIVKQINLATLPEIQWSGDMSGDLATRQDYGRQMREALLPVRPLIREGRQNLTKQLAGLEATAAGKLSAEDAVLLPKVVKLYESFDDTFDIEDKILDSMMSSARLYMSEESDDAISPEIDKNDLNFYALLEERVRLFNSRLTILE